MDNTIEKLVVGLILCFMLVLLGITFAAGSEVQSIKIEAVKRGAAEWKVDETGRTTFTWKEQGE